MQIPSPDEVKRKIESNQMEIVEKLSELIINKLQNSDLLQTTIVYPKDLLSVGFEMLKSNFTKAGWKVEDHCNFNFSDSNVYITVRKP